MAKLNLLQAESPSGMQARLPRTLSAPQRRGLEWALLALAVAFYAMCFLHLQADFPNFSPWNDWSKMTDEGWYGGGAIHYFVQGHWLLRDSFNPSVAMPVWPLLLAVWFKLTGVGMVAARALTVLIYGVSLVLLYALLRRTAGGLVAASGVVLMALNPFCYAFDRLAVLEPVLVLWMLAGLWVADRTRLEDIARPVVLGAIVILMVLTKTTGLFLAPAIAYQFWAVNGWPKRGWARPMAIMVLSALGIWIVYYMLAVRPHSADFQLIFSINHDRVHLSIVPQELWKVIRDGRWLSPVLFPAALLAVVGAMTGARALLKIPLFGSAVIAASGYLTFIGYHTNLQPRYFLVVTPAVVIVVVLAVAEFWDRGWRELSAITIVVLAVTGGLMAARTLRYVAHPEYSFVSAAADIAAKMRAQTDVSPVLLCNSGDDITLFTGVPSITIEYNTRGLDQVLRRYHPGWVALWAGQEDKWRHKLGDRYALKEMAQYRVFDDPERNHLVLYRLEEHGSDAAAVNGSR